MYTTANLLSAVNRRAFVPNGQTTFTDVEILDIADEILQNEILPTIMSVQEEYFVAEKDYNLTANLSSYEIPDRSIGLTVREVHFVNSSGTVYDLNRIEPEEIDSTTRTSATPEGFYIESNTIKVFPIPNSTSGTLKVKFYLTPSSLVEVADAAVISAIDTNTNIVTVSSIPSTWVTGNTFDLIKSSGGQECRAFDLISTLVSGNDITLPSLPSGLAVGDYIALQDQSPLVQLPKSFRSLLAQGVACFILDKMNLPGAEKENKRYEEALERVRNMIVPRTKGSPRSVPIPSFI